MTTLLIIFGAILADNLLLNRLFGIESFFTVNERPPRTAAYGGMVTLVTVVSGVLSLLLYKYVLVGLHMEFMATYISVVIISVIVFAVHILAKKLSRRFSKLFWANMPLISTNCVVLGSIMLCIENNISIPMSVLYLLCAGAGFTLAVLIFGAVRERLVFSEPPKAFEGLPILLLAASFAAMAFAGFFGLSF